MRVHWAGVLGAWSLFVWSHDALADARQCIQDNETATDLRQKGRLIEAKQAYLGCARPECPEVVRAECADFVASVDKSLSSVVVVLVDEQGREVAGGTALFDHAGEPEPIDGHARLLDPGKHTVEVKAPNGQTLEQPVVAPEGERNRLVTVRLAAPPKPSAPQAVEHRKLSPFVWVSGGVATVAWGSFAYFAITGKQQQSKLEKCAPTCANSAVDVMYHRYLVADISLGVAVVSTAVMGYLLFSPSDSPRSGVTAAVTPFGASLGYSAAF